MFAIGEGVDRRGPSGLGQSRSRTRGENDVAVDPAQGEPDRALVGTITQCRK